MFQAAAAAITNGNGTNNMLLLVWLSNEVCILRASSSTHQLSRNEILDCGSDLLVEIEEPQNDQQHTNQSSCAGGAVARVEEGTWPLSDRMVSRIMPAEGLVSMRSKMRTCHVMRCRM
jgi:hypothetical protein